MGALPMIFFSLFVFITYFGLMNMLIGAFCNAAMQVSMVENDLANVGILTRSLPEVLECYNIGSCNTIDQKQFALIIKNPDFIQILRRCGTDVDGLANLVRLLMMHQKDLGIDEFCRLITTL